MSNYFILLLLTCFLILPDANSTEKPKNKTIYSNNINSESNTDNSKTIINKDSIIVLIPRAYEFGQGNEKFCSPEISVTNLGSVGVRIIAVSIYFKKNGITIGSTISRISIDPNDTTTRGYYQLNTKNCDDITGQARVEVCFLRNGKDCSTDVIFADSGKITLQKAPEKTN